MSKSQKKVILVSLSLGLFFLFSCSGDTDNQEGKDSLASVSVDTLSVDSTALHPAQRVAPPWDSLYNSSPKVVFSTIMQGNARRDSNRGLPAAGYPEIPDSLARRRPLLVVTDFDMRHSVGELFDLPQSMIFQIGSPGCLVDARQVAAMEYAVLHSKTKVILILANSNSRIVGAACDNVKTDNFESIGKEFAESMKISPEFADRSSENRNFIRIVAENQAINSQAFILKKSPQIMQLVKEGKIVIKSASYDARSGLVTVLQPADRMTITPK